MFGKVPEVGRVGEPLIFSIECYSQHRDKCRDESFFFVRAYGPAILTGTTTRQRDGTYRVEILPLDPGMYTVEVVVTFSSPPKLDLFPMKGHAPILYEGYLVSGFPQSTNIFDHPKEDNVRQCTYTDLSVTAAPHQMNRARWQTVEKVRDQELSTNLAEEVTLRGYQLSRNSLGILLEYKFNDCQLPSNNDLILSDPHQFVLIGDSTMRIQKDVLEMWVQKTGVSHEIVFIELYGGIWRCQKFGPIVANQLHRLSQSSTDANKRIILANSGLHDIHRLCGSEWSQDRSTYLDPTQTALPCAELYRIGLKELVRNVLRTPAAIRIFQTTTAGWPKYGNYGVQWDPRYGQSLPLDATTFISLFNSVAIEVIGSSMDIVDGFWISLARPDNREVDERGKIGPKLSHPGHEVVHAMVNVWLALAIDRLKHLDHAL